MCSELRLQHFNINLVLIDEIVKKRQQFAETKDGDSCHFEKYTSG